MDINIRILSADESWQHQLDVYKSYHQKYSGTYSSEQFFYHPDLKEKFSKPHLSEEDLKTIETYFKTNIYDKNALEQAKQTVNNDVIPFLLTKNETLKQLPIKHPSNLTINLSGAMSGGFYNADDNQITISPQCITPNFMPLLVTHEFTHICTENEIQKQKLPHQAKERIVSRICSEILDFDDHNPVGDKEIDEYLTKDRMLSNFSQTLTDIKKHYSNKQFLIKNKKYQTK